MGDKTSKGTYPTCPNANYVPCLETSETLQNTVKTELSGYVGYVGHVGRGGTMLAGLFGNPDDPNTLSTSRGSDQLGMEPVSSVDVEPLGGGPDCQFCESAKLEDCENPPGIRCGDCGRLCWVDDGSAITRIDMVQWFDSVIESDGVRPMNYQTPPVESARGPVTCEKCDAKMIPSDIEVNGWRNWDCKKCGHVHPRRESGK